MSIVFDLKKGKKYIEGRLIARKINHAGMD
jgi:hypothetical protein